MLCYYIKIVNSLVTKIRTRMSKQTRLIHSLTPLVVMLALTLIIILSAKPTPNTQSAKLVIEKTPLVSNTATPKPVAASTPIPANPTKTTTTVIPSPNTAIKVVTPSSTVQQATTPSQAPGTSVANNTPPTPSETPLSALTAVITYLEEGQSADITASSVVIPGPIGDATGQPIVFIANNQTYFAYTQEQEPNFNTTPAQTAATMAIVVEPAADSGVTLSQAHLDKTGLLVDENELAVGYSTGGDNSGK
jgi:hypothetical protein